MSVTGMTFSARCCRGGFVQACASLDRQWKERSSACKRPSCRRQQHGRPPRDSVEKEPQGLIAPIPGINDNSKNLCRSPALEWLSWRPPGEGSQAELSPGSLQAAFPDPSPWKLNLKGQQAGKERIFINSSFKISTFCLLGTHLEPRRRIWRPAAEKQNCALVTHFLLAFMETDVSEEIGGQIQTCTSVFFFGLIGGSFAS